MLKSYLLPFLCYLFPLTIPSSIAFVPSHQLPAPSSSSSSLSSSWSVLLPDRNNRLRHQKSSTSRYHPLQAQENEPDASASTGPIGKIFQLFFGKKQEKPLGFKR